MSKKKDNKIIRKRRYIEREIKTHHLQAPLMIKETETKEYLRERERDKRVLFICSLSMFLILGRGGAGFMVFDISWKESQTSFRYFLYVFTLLLIIIIIIIIIIS